MSKDLVTIQEAALLMGKSVQTLRRMIRKGELHSQRMKSPQGFRYLLDRDELGIPPKKFEPEVPRQEASESPIQEFSNSTIQKPNEAQSLKENFISTIQDQILTSQTPVEPHKTMIFGSIDKNVQKNDENGEIIVEFENQRTSENLPLGESIQIHRIEAAEPLEKQTISQVMGANRSSELSRQLIEQQEMLKAAHEEKMGLIRLAASLQERLEQERSRPRSFLAYLIEWLSK